MHLHYMTEEADSEGGDDWNSHSSTRVTEAGFTPRTSQTENPHCALLLVLGQVQEDLLANVLKVTLGTLSQIQDERMHWHKRPQGGQAQSREPGHHTEQQPDASP